MKVVQPEHGSFVVDQVAIVESVEYSVDQEAPLNAVEWPGHMDL